MIVAITSTGNTLKAKLDSRFGRCAYVALYDTESGAVEFVPNPHQENIEGAGTDLAALVAGRGVQKVVSGEFGVKAKSLFDRMRIQLILLKDQKKISDIIGMLDHKPA